MLGLFASKHSHPLGDAKEAKRVYAELAASEPASALDDATVWLESLVGEDSFKLEQRLEILLQIDAAVLPAARRFAREYAAAAYTSRSEELRLWKRGHEYWHQLAAIYGQCLDAASGKAGEAIKPQLPLLCARALHAQAAWLKWQQFRYGPIDPVFWQTCGAIYLYAAMAGIAQKSCTLYPSSAATTTPEREYLEILAFHASSMDSLLPQEIELAERLLDFLLPHFVFGNQANPDSVYWVDAARAVPPTRLAKLPEAGANTLRFFSPGIALDTVFALQQELSQATTIPSSLNLGAAYSLPMVLGVLDHLAAYWSPVPPQRSHARHRVKSRIGVVHGLAAVYRRLAGVGVGEINEESWLVEDVSQGGMRAQATLAGGSRLSVATLIAMQPEGGSNWLVGIVRRFTRESETSGAVGIETVSKAPQALCVDSGGIQTEVILLDPWENAGEVRVVIPATAWEEGIPMTFYSGSRLIRLVPYAQDQGGPDYVIGKYKVRIAE